MVVYILECCDGKFYIGQTQNLNERLKEHRINPSKAMKPRLPCKLVGYIEVGTRSEAVRLERKLKKWKKQQAVLKYIATQGRVAQLVRVPR